MLKYEAAEVMFVEEEKLFFVCPPFVPHGI